MQWCSGRARRALGGALLLACAASAMPAVAQNVTRTRFGVAYVANAPDVMAGGGAYVILPVAGGLGVYVDAKFDASDPTRKSNYLPALTAQQVENQFPDDFLMSSDSWRAFDVALLRPLRPALAVYAGAGYARRRTYNEYRDDTGTRGTAGHYWVEDTAARTNAINLMGGFMFRMSSVVNTMFGLESSPHGVTVGVSLALPRQ